MAAFCLSAGVAVRCGGLFQHSVTSLGIASADPGVHSKASPDEPASSVPVSRLRGESLVDAAEGAVPNDAGSADNNNSKRRGRRRKLLSSGNPSQVYPPAGESGGGGETSRGGDGGGGSRKGKRHLEDSSSGDEIEYHFDPVPVEDEAPQADDELEEEEEEDGGDDGICAPLEVVGLEDCPELTSDGGAILEKMLAAKTDLLRQVKEKSRTCVSTL